MSLAAVLLAAVLAADDPVPLGGIAVALDREPSGPAVLFGDARVDRETGALEVVVREPTARGERARFELDLGPERAARWLASDGGLVPAERAFVVVGVPSALAVLAHDDAVEVVAASGRTLRTVAAPGMRVVDAGVLGGSFRFGGEAAVLLVSSEEVATIALSRLDRVEPVVERRHWRAPTGRSVVAACGRPYPTHALALLARHGDERGLELASLCPAEDAAVEEYTLDYPLAWTNPLGLTAADLRGVDMDVPLRSWVSGPLVVTCWPESRGGRGAVEVVAFDEEGRAGAPVASPTPPPGCASSTADSRGALPTPSAPADTRRSQGSRAMSAGRHETELPPTSGWRSAAQNGHSHGISSTDDAIVTAASGTPTRT